MKKYIILGLTLLMAFPFSAVAQDEESRQDQLEALARRLMPKQKQYPTRVIRGRIVNATTGNPIAGAIVSADGIDGYSTLTEDNGTYKLKVPEFTTSVFVNMPDLNPVRMGCIRSFNSFCSVLLSSTGEPFSENSILSKSKE